MHCIAYATLTGELPEVSRDELYVHTARSRKVMVEVVGEAKIQARQSKIHLLTSARVVGAAVSHIVSQRGWWLRGGELT